MSFENNFVLLYAGLIIIGVGAQAGVSIFWSLPTRYLTAGAAAAAIGLINAIGGLGSFTGPYIIGDIQTATGSFFLAYSLVLVSFVVAIACLFALAYVDRKRPALAGDKTL